MAEDANGLCIASVKRRRRTIALRVLLTLAFGAAFAFAIKGVPVHAVIAKIGSFPPWTLAAVLGATLVQITAQASRLWLVFPHPRRPSWASVARAFSFGQLANMSLPARAGDVVKVFALARDRGRADSGAERTSVADATGALLADRALDIGTMCVLGACVGGSLMRGEWPSPVHLVTIVAAPLAVAFVGWRVLRRKWPSVAAKVRGAGKACLANLKALRHPARLSRGIVLGCVAVAAEVLALVALSSALGVSLSLGSALTVVIVLCLGIAVPVSIANIGAFEASIALGMSYFGVSATNAIAIGAVHHVVQFAGVALAAFAFWQRDRGTRAMVACTARAAD